MVMNMRLAWALALLLGPGAAIAAEPVRQIGIYVQPFYQAARTPDGRPRYLSASNTTTCSARIAVKTSSPCVT